MKAFARLSLFAAAWAAAIGLLACQSQGVGERCSTLNGNADCDTDLVCGESQVCCVPGSAQCTSVAGAAGSGGGAADAGASDSSDASDASDSSDASADADAGFTGDSDAEAADTGDGAVE
jgi:hypothetical protein